MQQVKNILELGKVLDDITSAGKMRDIYCLKLFTFANVIKLLRNEDYLDASFLFPFACWICVVYSISIDLPFRLFLIELSFQMINCFREQFAPLKQNGVIQKEREKANIITVHEEQYMIRMLNSLIATALAFDYATNYVRSDSVGTHLVENNIGIARQTSTDPR